jgi:hypothetical protein
MKFLKNLTTLIVILTTTIFSYAQTVVTVGGGASITCPAVPTATWTTPPSGVTISNWSRGSGVTCASATNGLAGSAFNTTNFSTSFSGNKFYTFTITTNSTTTLTISRLTWLTSVSSGSANFTVGYRNNGGSFTTFGTTAQTSTSSNTFNGSVTVSPGTSIIMYLIPSGTNAVSRTVRFGNNSTITMTANVPTITTSGTLAALSTTYGTSSASTSFNVSATNLVSSVTITPPVGFEVSTSNLFTTFGTNTSPITVGTSGTLSSTPIYVRLASSTVPGTYNSQSISLTATGATTKTVTTLSTGNTVNTKSLIVSSPSVTSKVYDGTTTATITGTLNGIVGSDVVTFNGTGTFASANAGSSISVTSTSTISGTHASRYTLTQPTSLTGTITKAAQTITFNGLPYKSTFDVDFLPIATTTSGLPLTFSSSDLGVASIVAGKIKINGIGTSTITASQAGDGNYFAATSVSSELSVSDPISRWSFDNITISGTGQTPTITGSGADVGMQTEGTSVSGFHTSVSTVWSSPVGNGNVKSISSNFWSTNDYFRYNVNTQYTTIIKLTFDQTSSGTGPKDFKLQYSLDGTNFTDITTYSVPFNTTSNTEYSWSSTNFSSASTLSFDLSSVTEINDQPNVQFRMVNTSTSALLGGTIQTAGTSRMDNFTTFGNMDIPLPLNVISFKGKSFGSQNRLEWTLSEWGMVKIQKYINGVWVEVGQTDNNVWFDTKPYKGISYYRIVSNKTFSNPIYVVNEMGFEPSSSDFTYYDFNGKRLNKVENNKIIIRKSEFDSEKVMVLD